MGKASITISIGTVFNGDGLGKAMGELNKWNGGISRIERITAASAGSMASNIGKIGIAAEDAGRRYQDAGRRIARAGDGLSRAVTLPLVAAGTYAGKMAVDFDTALASVRKTSDLTEAELEALAESALEMSTTQPVSAEAILSVEALGAQLGVAGDKLEDFAVVATGLDIATNMNAEQAGTEMARFANIVGMTEDEYSNYGSTLVEIGNNMATTESEVSQMAQRFASAGIQAGLSEAEVLGLSGAMSALGIKSEMGGSALSQVFVGISKAVDEGGPKLEAFASTAGMSAEEFRAAWEDNAADAFTTLLQGIHDASEAGADMNTVLGELGITQIRQSDVMRRMAGSVDEVTGALDLSRGAWERNTALQDEVDQRNESMASRLQVLKNKVDAVAITVGRPLVDAVIAAMDALDPAVQAVSSCARAFADMDEAGQRNVIALAGIAAAAGPVLSVAGRLTEGFGKVVSAVGSGVSKIAVYSDAMMGLDGANLRTYASSKSLASSVGLARNAAVKAAGGVDEYVGAWDRMRIAAGRAEKAERAISDILAECGGNLEDASKAQQKRAAALQADRDAAAAAYKENAKLVTAWGDSTQEARRAAKGVKALEGPLGEIEEQARTGSISVTAASKSITKMGDESKRAGMTLGQTVANGFGLAGASIKNFIVSAAPMVAVTAAVGLLSAAVAHCVEENRKLEEHQRLVSDATTSASEIMLRAKGAYYEAGDAIGSIEPKAAETLESLKALNEQAVESLTELEVNRASLDQYVATIEELGGRSDLTATQQERLRIAVEGYNEITGDSISLMDDASNRLVDQNGKLLENSDQIRDNARAWEERAEKEAYAALAQDYLEERIKAEGELKIAQERRAEILEQIAEKQEQINSAWARGDGDRVAELAGDIEALNTELATTEQDIKDLSAASEQAGRNYAHFSTEAAIATSSLSESVKESIRSLPPEFQAFALDLAASLDASGQKVGTFEENLASMGLSMQDVEAIGAENFAALYEACSGNLEMMGWCIENYNSVPLVDKDGKVDVNDASLVDAQGNVWTWNGTKFTSKTTKASVDDVELMDAQGRVYTWNGTRLVSKDAVTDVDSDSVAKGNEREDERNDKKVEDKEAETDIDYSSTEKDIAYTEKRRRNPPRNQSASTTINRYENTHRRVYTSNAYDAGGRHAAGGIVTHAMGGVIRHADGFILNRATDITRHIAGEDGAEAIIPLTNRRYTRPFARTVAEEAVSLMGGGRGDSYTLVINGGEAAGVSPAVRDALRVIFGEYSDTIRMGVA